MFEYFFDYFCILINLINELGFKEKSDMGESFRIIPEFRTFSLSVSFLKVFDHKTLELLIIWRHTASFNFDFLKFRILEILNFHP